jgi:predicted dehydrogenase
MIAGNVVVVGLGSIGERHVRNLLKLGQSQITVVRRDPAKRPRTLQGTEFRTVTSLQAALDERPPAVIVANPTALHDEVVWRAVDGGIHVLLEVPASHALEGLDRADRRARETGAQVVVAHNLRFHPALRAIHAAVHDGAIGQPLYTRAQFGEYLPACHAWEDYRGRYEARADLGGGVMLTSIHELDHAYWLCGPVAAVTCVARTIHFSIDVEDVAMMILEHRSGVLSEIELDFVQRTYRRSLQVTGVDGTIEWELLGDRVRLFEARTNQWQDLVVLDGYDFNETYLDELRHFAAVMRGSESPHVGLADARHVLEAGLAALQSSKERRRVEVAFEQVQNGAPATAVRS